MEINPENMPPGSVYKILIGTVVPRPIGWISSVDTEGVPNLAPFSFFNVVGNNPPMVIFSPMVRGTDKQSKDTLRNVQATGEFVVNIVTEDLAEAMNITSTEFPAGVNEFEAAGLEAVPSRAVRPPRVGQSPVHFECTVHQIVPLGSANLVIGRIIHLHVAENILINHDKIDILRLRPIGRLAGSGYCRVTDLFELKRPSSQLEVQT